MELVLGLIMGIILIVGHHWVVLALLIPAMVVGEIIAWYPAYLIAKRRNKKDPTHPPFPFNWRIFAPGRIYRKWAFEQHRIKLEEAKASKYMI